MRSFLDAVPLFPLALALATAGAAAFAPVLGRWTRARTLVAFLLLASLGLVAAATLLPTASALTGNASDGTCDLTRLGFPTLSEVRSNSQTRLNLVLFLPLGVALALLPVGPKSLALAAAAVLLPFLIEGFQLSVQMLGRGCQSADVIDNLAGLALGLVAGSLMRFVIGAPRLSRR